MDDEAHPNALRRIVDNLLDTALTTTPAGGSPLYRASSMRMKPA
jgi:hypothetical protein